MRILGIDQSFTSTGLCVMEDDFLSLEDLSIVETKKANGDDFDRAHDIGMHIVDHILKYEIEKVNIEGLAFGAKGDATRKLGGLQFVVVNAIRSVEKKDGTRIPVNIVAPTSLKKFATGNGRASKEDVIDSLPDHIKERVIQFNKANQSDLADAFWLAMYE